MQLTILQKCIIYFLAVVMAVILASPVAFGTFTALSHEGIDIVVQKSKFEGIASTGGIIYIIVVLLFAFGLKVNMDDVIYGGKEERAYTISSIFKLSGIQALIGIVIGSLVYLGYRIFV